MLTDRERCKLTVYKLMARFPRPAGLKGFAYDEGVKEIQTGIVNLPDTEIEAIGRDIREIWFDPSRKT